MTNSIYEESIFVSRNYMCGRCGVEKVFTSGGRKWEEDTPQTTVTVARNQIKAQVANTEWGPWSTIHMMCPACHRFIKKLQSEDKNI